MKPMITEVNAATGETIEREMTEEEFERFEAIRLATETE